MYIFRGDLLANYLNTNLSSTFPGGVFFGEPLKQKSSLTCYFRAFDTPNGVNSFVRCEFTIYGNETTTSQALFNSVATLRDTFIEICGFSRKVKEINFGGYIFDYVKEGPQIGPDRDMSNLPVIKKDFLFYYNGNV